MNDWFAVQNSGEVPSPALLLYPDRIGENIRRMIVIAGGVGRLRPHIKTHKLAEVVRMHLEAGISKFKCATIAEAEMAATAGARDVLIAFPMVGPNVPRLRQLVSAFPGTSFSCVTDAEPGVRALSTALSGSERPLSVLLDINCGQHRTGIEPGADATRLYRLIASSPGLVAGGLHVYDGHIHEPDAAKRASLYAKTFGPVEAFRQELISAGLAVPRVVAGGTPTFPLHARNQAVECSPGTCVLWDFGYAEKFTDLDFLLGAVVLTRVVSKPGSNRLTLDLGHKAIAAENPPPRVQFPQIPDAKEISHSEEHLVIETAHAAKFLVGDVIFGVPRHICPTVALYSEATVISGGRATERWRITARERRLNI